MSLVINGGISIMSNTKYKRIVLKVSGEALAGDQGFGINPEIVKVVVNEIKSVHDLGVQLPLSVAVGTSGVV